MAIVKQGLCAAPTQPRPQPLSLQPPIYWHQPGMRCSGEPTLGHFLKESFMLCASGFFPSEPTFVPNPAASGSAAGEDEGVLLLTALQGATRLSFLVVLDARTMTELARLPVAATMTFSTHGQFYANLHAQMAQQPQPQTSEGSADSQGHPDSPCIPNYSINSVCRHH
jgi:hypothetical protein